MTAAPDATAFCSVQVASRGRDGWFRCQAGRARTWRSCAGSAPGLRDLASHLEPHGRKRPAARAWRRRDGFAPSRGWRGQDPAPPGYGRSASCDGTGTITQDRYRDGINASDSARYAAAAHPGRARGGGGLRPNPGIRQPPTRGHARPAAPLPFRPRRPVPTAMARIGPDTDLTDIAVLMTDYNLTTIPVVDAQCRILGLITSMTCSRPRCQMTGGGARPPCR
jgi:hypothetical protein